MLTSKFTNVLVTINVLMRKGEYPRPNRVLIYIIVAFVMAIIGAMLILTGII